LYVNYKINLKVLLNFKVSDDLLEISPQPRGAFKEEKKVGLALNIT